MRKPSRVLVGTAAAVTVVLTATGATASAGAPGAGPAPVVKEIAQGRQDGPLDVSVKEPVQVNFREITLPPGGSTGRHCHYGQLIAVVKSGTLTHYAPDHEGGVRVYRAGDSVVEGSGYVHEGRNEGSEDMVLWVTYVTPEGKPLAESDLAHCGAGR
ncbi:cupin domain-containing protein [Streptomyces sp. NPDC059917]|uniref:cupin domain-containing protein n=1 Tax=Streptomyces sp. NPDC059917 TaxID=3347002 RepID=UPI00365D72E7